MYGSWGNINHLLVVFSEWYCNTTRNHLALHYLLSQDTPCLSHHTHTWRSTPKLCVPQITMEIRRKFWYFLPLRTFFELLCQFGHFSNISSLSKFYENYFRSFAFQITTKIWFIILIISCRKTLRLWKFQWKTDLYNSRSILEISVDHLNIFRFCDNVWRFNLESLGIRRFICANQSRNQFQREDDLYWWKCIVPIVWRGDLWTYNKVYMWAVLTIFPLEMR